MKILTALLVLALWQTPASAASVTVVYSFTNGSDGALPLGTPIVYRGSIYGTTDGGKASLGNIYRLYPNKSGGFTAVDLHDFTGSDGSAPIGNIAVDTNGNLYGVTEVGGAHNLGTAWELVRPANLADPWALQVLWNFGTGAELGLPTGGLVFNNGSFYGFTDACLFRLLPVNGSYQFQVVAYNPPGSVSPLPSFDSAGNVYAAVIDGGLYIDRYSLSSDGTWTATQITQPGVGATNGPVGLTGGLLMDSTGAFYGVSAGGGAYFAGTIYKMSQTSSGQWLTSILRSFNPANEYAPNYTLFYSKARYYGILSLNQSEVFQAYASATSKQWTVNDLLDAGSNSTAGTNYVGFTFDSTGNIYGASAQGGAYGYGAIWKIVP